MQHTKIPRRYYGVPELALAYNVVGFSCASCDLPPSVVDGSKPIGGIGARICTEGGSGILETPPVYGGYFLVFL